MSETSSDTSDALCYDVIVVAHSADNSLNSRKHQDQAVVGSIKSADAWQWQKQSDERCRHHCDYYEQRATRPAKTSIICLSLFPLLRRTKSVCRVVDWKRQSQVVKLKLTRLKTVTCNLRRFGGDKQLEPRAGPCDVNPELVLSFK